MKEALESGHLTHIKKGTGLMGEDIIRLNTRSTIFRDVQLWTVLLMVLEVDQSVGTLVAAEQE